MVERRAWDVLALTAVAVAALTGMAYLGIMVSQRDDPAAWFGASLALATALGAYGAARAARWRRAALAACGALLGVLGVLGILSIGAPLLVAGALALVATARSGHGTAAHR